MVWATTRAVVSVIIRSQVMVTRLKYFEDFTLVEFGSPVLVTAVGMYYQPQSGGAPPIDIDGDRCTGDRPH